MDITKEHLNWLANMFTKARARTKGADYDDICELESRVRLMLKDHMGLHLPFIGDLYLDD